MTTFSQKLQSLHSLTPERVAVTLQHSGQPDLPISYRQLLRGANAYARTYARQEIKPGEVVILILQHGEDLVYSFWGAILQSAIPSIMPFLTEKLAPERYRTDLAALISVTKPTAIVTYPEFESEVRGALKESDSVRAVILTDKLESQADPDFDSLPGMK